MNQQQIKLILVNYKLDKPTIHVTDPTKATIEQLNHNLKLSF
ncbi:hypothetical protein [Spiroplasma poulsonii]|nr:hypothetical protein [Spiroplasma poulsonii]